MPPSTSAAVGVVAQGLRLRLRVKARAGSARQGVWAVTDDHVELCVAAPARDGEANKAVVRLLSELLGLPASRFSLCRGLRSRDKTVEIGGLAPDEARALARTLSERLQASCH